MAGDDSGSWIRGSYSYSWFERLALAVVKVGRVPKHVAIIMDGNRRFARLKGLPKLEGHKGGFDKLAETLQWCRDLGVTQVTVYAFSIENFKRSAEEVEQLMELATQKFRLLVGEKDKLCEQGVRVRVLGDRARLPTHLQEVIRQAEEVTAGNRAATLNIALSYTGREEIAQAVRGAVREGQPITQQSIESHLYTDSSPDLLIRTSGETRLSDFLLWQCSHSVLYFTQVLWPDFSLLHLLGAVIFYQRNVSKVEAIMGDIKSNSTKHRDIEKQADVAQILDSIKNK